MYLVIRRTALRAINKILAAFGLELRSITHDFDARVLSEHHLDILYRRMAAELRDWFGSQRLFDCAELPDFERETRDFYAAYLKSPYRVQSGGSRFNNLLWLSMIAKCYNPDIVVDSGTFRGASAWALSLGAPKARILSFDVDLSSLVPGIANVSFFETDWTAQELKAGADTRVLAYFDDHLDQARRLTEAAARGVNIAVFDDDFPITAFAAMARTSQPLPKIEFLLDAAMNLQDELVWTTGRGTNAWKPDPERFGRAASLIGATDRLPNTSLITGIHQTPYRIVKIRHSDKAGQI